MWKWANVYEKFKDGMCCGNEGVELRGDLGGGAWLVLCREMRIGKRGSIILLWRGITRRRERTGRSRQIPTANINGTYNLV